MGDVREIPDLIREAVDLSKAYLVQETVEPAKQLGRFAGLSLGAAVCFAVGAVLIAVAGMRYLIRALPAGPGWEALGYIVAAIVLALAVFVMVKVTTRSTARGR